MPLMRPGERTLPGSGFSKHRWSTCRSELRVGNASPLFGGIAYARNNFPCQIACWGQRFHRHVCAKPIHCRLT
jgi:hypothetical protein